MPVRSSHFTESRVNPLLVFLRARCILKWVPEGATFMPGTS